MNKLFFVLAALLIWGCKMPSQKANLPLYIEQKLPLEKTLTTIALGSCNREYKSQKLWPVIAKDQPDLWVWLGDAVYSDTENPKKMKAAFMTQKYNAYYTDFRASTPIIGIWDDHDYGMDDGDKTFKSRAEHRDLFFDFLDVSATQPARQREGAYQTYTFGEEGKRVKFLLLDARYFRDELVRNPTKKTRYYISETGDMLGEKQWEWLEAELAKNDADVHIIASGVQILSEEHRYEKWANFPKSYNRLMDLLVKHQPNRTLLVSGDRHISEVSRIELEGLGYPLYDLTISGMTHAYEGFLSEANKHRVSEVVHQKNYGLIKIDWEQNTKIQLELKGAEGQVVLRQLIAI